MTYYPRIAPRGDGFSDAIRLNVLARFTNEQIIDLAKKIRTECHSGYNWNAPKRWEDIHELGRWVWLKRAMLAMYEPQREDA